ncbi:MAG: metallophosphoesterase [Deltaproteobacteria bacterium]|nr:metallophosphoesterase [Deltaproteobacteria bacterium]
MGLKPERGWILGAGLAVLAALGARAEAREVQLVAPGAEGWQYDALELPTLPSTDPLGRTAVLAASTAASSAGSTAGGRTPSWARAEGGDWQGPGAAPFVAIGPGMPCTGCGTPLGGRDDVRVAALKLRRRFDVPGLAGLRVLTLKVRYQDGIVVFLNGVQIAQRLLTANGPGDAGATAAHGPEWETIALPIVPWLLKDKGNVLALEVRPHEDRPLLLDLELLASDAPRILVGPFLLLVEPGRAVVTAETDLPATMEVRYGAAPGGTTLARLRTGPGKHHEFELTGLGEETYYRAAVLVGGRVVAETEDIQFHAPPKPGEPIRFAVYGDVRGGPAVHTQVIAGVAGFGADFFVTTGDMVARGHDEGDWQKTFQIITPLTRSVPMYPALGNHEWGAGAVAIPRYRELFAQPARSGDPYAVYYSFDVADLHFIFLDSNYYDSELQLAWLVDDLAAARKRKPRAIFAVAHHGPVSRGPHGGNEIALEKYVPLLQRAGAAAFFSGHDHTYERGSIGQMQYVVTGGAGAPLYRASCGRPGFKNCRDAAKAFAVEYHYVTVEVMNDFFKMCATRPDGSALEACVSFPLPGMKKKSPRGKDKVASSSKAR